MIRTANKIEKYFENEKWLEIASKYKIRGGRGGKKGSAVSIEYAVLKVKSSYNDSILGLW